MRPKGTAAELEWRRRDAVRLVEEGHTEAQAARMVGANRSSVNRWWKAYCRHGPEALGRKPATGAPCKLTDRQKQELIHRIREGPKANGFSTDLWTCPRIVQLIEKLYGVRYHVGSMSRFLRGLGLTPQKPQRRAVEQDKEKIADWIAHDWPRIKKSHS